MENTKFIYAVNSDLDDELFYAEFGTKEAAIEYATKHLDKLPFVDEVELAYDAEGIEDAISYKTIWDHTMAVSEAPAGEPSEEDYWDMMTAEDVPSESSEAISESDWLETDGLVEAMEENEDMVECKECFELFPKADCVKLEIGYICPHCNCDSDVADEDTFKVDFPEYEKFSEPNDFVDYHSDEAIIPNEEVPASEPVSVDDPGLEGPVGLTSEEAVPFLVNDEVEAVAGYEKAAEVVENSDLENKEEILDTIEHIKEEEEEHIEELQDLMPGEKEDEIIEVENDPISNEAEESEEVEDTEEELVEHINDSAESGDEFKLEEETHAQYAKPEGDRMKAYNQALFYAKKYNKPFIYGYTAWGTGKFFALEQPIKVTKDSAAAEKEFRSQYKNCATVYVAYPDKDYAKLHESLYNFTEEEMTEYNMDEDGVSLNSYDEYVRCNWCGEIYTVDDCEFEADLGWLCDRCYSAIISRGEKLTIIKNPTDEDIAKTLTEAIPMTRDELIDKEGTDDVELINAGRPEEDRVEIID